MAISQTPPATNAVDVVGVFNSRLAQVFPLARPVTAEILPEAQLMEHPLENGASIVDHRILLPIIINIPLLLTSRDYASVYNQVFDLYTRGEKLTVQTRVRSYRNMVIEKIPHEEAADLQDGVAMTITFREAAFVIPQFSTVRVATPRDSSTVKRGEQQPKAAPPQRGSILSRIFS